MDYVQVIISSAPGLSWNAMLKLRRIALKPFSDPVMYILFESKKI